MCKITVDSTTMASTPIPHCFVRRVLINHNNWISCRGIHVLHYLGGLHSLDVCHGALYNIASDWLASSLVFAAAMCPTVSGCFATRWPHDPKEPAQPLESPSGLGLVARLPVALRQHHTP